MEQAVVTKEEAEALAEEIQLKFYRTSVQKKKKKRKTTTGTRYVNDKES